MKGYFRMVYQNSPATVFIGGIYNASMTLTIRNKIQWVIEMIAYICACSSDPQI